MNELQEKLERAYTLISTLPVRGDGVEIMAQAKALMRETFKLAEKEQENG